MASLTIGDFNETKAEECPFKIPKDAVAIASLSTAETVLELAGFQILGISDKIYCSITQEALDKLHSKADSLEPHGTTF